MYAQPMFYVVSKRLGEAMARGDRKRPAGTVYGIFATREKAEAMMREKRVFMRDGKNGPTIPAGYSAMIVEQ